MRRSPRRQAQKNPERDRERVNAILRGDFEQSSSYSSNSSNSYSSDSSNLEDSNDEEEEQMFAFITSSELKKKQNKNKKIIDLTTTSIDSSSSTPFGQSISSISTSTDSHSSKSISSNSNIKENITTPNDSDKEKNKTKSNIKTRKTNQKKKKANLPTLQLHEIIKSPKKPIDPKTTNNQNQNKSKVPERIEITLNSPSSSNSNSSSASLKEFKSLKQHQNPTNFKNELTLIMEEHNLKESQFMKPKKDFKEKQILSKLEQEQKKVQIRNLNQTKQKTSVLVKNHTELLGNIFDIPSSESNEPFTRDNEPMEIAQADMITMFLFNIYEEGNKLFLFGKYRPDPTQYGTICVAINSPTRTLSFLPIIGKEKELEGELTAIFGSSLISMDFVEKSEFDEEQTETKQWLEVNILSTFSINNFPSQGQNYVRVNGVSASITENFLLRNKIKGCRWLQVHCMQNFTKHTVVPFFVCNSFSDITIITDDKELQKPSINICIFSLFKRFINNTNRKNGNIQGLSSTSSSELSTQKDKHNNDIQEQIYMISARILYQWDYEKFCEYEDLRAGHKVTNFILNDNDSNQKQQKRSSQTIVYCDNEEQLLSSFFNHIEHYDVDILCSYDLINKDLPILISKSSQIPEQILLGRFHRSNPITSILQATAGRLIFDLKHFYSNILHQTTNSLSSLVREEISQRMPNITSEEIFETIPTLQQYHWNNLIGFSRTITNLLHSLIENKKLLMVCFSLSRITGSPLNTIMQGNSVGLIEDQLLLAFFRSNYIIPDCKKNDIINSLNISSFLEDFIQTKEGNYNEGYSCLYECPHFLSQIIRQNNICFTTIHKQTKKRGIISSLLTEYQNTIVKLEEQIQDKILLYKKSKDLIEDSMSSFETASVESMKQKQYEFEGNISLSHILALQSLFDCFEDFFIVGSRRFNVSKLRETIRESTENFITLISNKLKTNYPCIIWSSQNTFLCSSKIQDFEQAKLTFVSFLESFNSHNKKMHIELVSLLKKTLIFSPFSFFAINEKEKIISDETKTPSIINSVSNQFIELINQQNPSPYKTNPSTQQFKFKSNWNAIERDLAENLFEALLKSENNADCITNCKTEIKKSLDLLKNDKIKSLTPQDFAIPFFTWQTFDDNSQIPSFIKEEKKKSTIDLLEDKVSICFCRNSMNTDQLIIKLPNELKDTSSLDISFYYNRILTVVNEIIKPFPDILSELKKYKFSLQTYENELSISCSFCSKKISFPSLNAENKCPFCGSIMTWKYLANQLISSIRSIVSYYFSGRAKCTQYLCNCSTMQIQMQSSSSNSFFASTFFSSQFSSNPFGINSMESHQHPDPCNETKLCKGKLTFQEGNVDPFYLFTNLLSFFQNTQNSIHEELREFMIRHIMKISSMYGIDVSSKKKTRISQDSVPFLSSSQSDVCSFLSQD